MKSRLRTLFTMKKNDDGYVLITVLGICFLAVVIVSSITAITISDLVFNARVRAVIESKHAAESAMDAYYVAINDGSSTNITTLSQKFVRVEGTTSMYPVRADELSLATGSSATSATTRYETPYSQEWFTINDEGVLGGCGDNFVDVSEKPLPCFKMKLVQTNTRPYTVLSAGQVNGTSIISDNQRVEYSIDIVVRHMCLNNNDPEEPEGCVFSRFQQRVRQREFVKHVVMSETEDIAPVVYSSVPTTGGLQLAVINDVKHNSYANNDTVAGNIHTNGEAIYRCNDFSLDDYYVTAAASSGGSAVGTASDQAGTFSQCNGSDPEAIFSAARPEFSLPSRSGDASGSRLKAMALSEDASRYYLGAEGTTTTINFQGSTTGAGRMTVGSQTYAVPSFGVIFVEGVALVKGELKGKVTVYATQGIQVGDNSETNMVYQDDNRDLLGLITPGDIVLHCKQSSPGSRCDNKIVEGLLRAGGLTKNPVTGAIETGGTIYNNEWNSSPAGGAAPTLTINGGLISGYRGTFGAMDSGNAGFVTNGWRKDFTWDSRLKSQQPPYMLRDSLAVFIRSSLRDLPCDFGDEEVCTNNPS